MSTLKTQENDGSVADFVAAIDDPQRRDECQQLVELMSSVLKAQPKMWGESIVGFGGYQYRYASGREGEWFVAGFSPRKKALTLYVMGCATTPEMLADLGPVTTGKSCIYVKRLSDLHLPSLKKMIRAAQKECKAISAAAQEAKAAKPERTKAARKKK